MTIDQTLSVAGREWRRLGVPSRDRRVLAADLRVDLEAAMADGVPADQLIAGDLKVFARRLAEEAGVEHASPRYGQIIATALAGAVIGMLVGLIVVVGVRTILKAFGFDLFSALATIVSYVGIGLVALGGAVAAVLILLRHLPAIGRTALAITVLTPLTTVVMVPLLMLLARLTGYSTSIAIVLVEVGLPIAGFVGATALARRWSLA
jgi:hypothetical protein